MELCFGKTTFTLYLIIQLLKRNLFLPSRGLRPIFRRKSRWDLMRPIETWQDQSRRREISYDKTCLLYWSQKGPKLLRLYKTIQDYTRLYKTNQDVLTFGSHLGTHCDNFGIAGLNLVSVTSWSRPHFWVWSKNAPAYLTLKLIHDIP